MSKLPLAVCIIVICCLLAVPLLALPILTAPDNPQADSQSTVQPTIPPTPPPTIEPTRQDNPEQPQSEPVNTPQKTPTPTWHPSSPTNAPQSLNRTLSEAVGNATKYFKNSKEPYALLMLDVLYRRFGITAFNNSLEVYDEQLAGNFYNEPTLRVFRRIADYQNTILQSTDFDSISSENDLVTVPALYSDRLALPNDYNSTFHRAVDSGGYLLTHALLASIWLKENHCNFSLSDDYMQALYQANAAIIDEKIITDLNIEAAAFLCLAGQGELVNDSFIQQVIAVQNPDGGWTPASDAGDISNWHTSVLGLMLLLHVQYPAESYPPVLAPSEQST